MRSDARDRSLAALVVKQGVAIGGLGEPQRHRVLALAAAALPATQSLDERGVNDHLLAWLAGVGAFLRTDHVELRRWLCDSGFVQRDGYGRAYLRAPASGLLAPQRAAAEEVAALGGDAAAWVAAQREAVRQARIDRAAARRPPPPA